MANRCYGRICVPLALTNERHVVCRALWRHGAIELVGRRRHELDVLCRSVWVTHAASAGAEPFLVRVCIPLDQRDTGDREGLRWGHGTARVEVRVVIECLESERQMWDKVGG